MNILLRFFNFPKSNNALIWGQINGHKVSFRLFILVYLQAVNIGLYSCLRVAVKCPPVSCVG